MLSLPSSFSFSHIHTLFFFSLSLLLSIDGELEDHILGSQGSVHLGEGVQLSLDVLLHIRRQLHLHLLGTIHPVSSSSANDLRGVHNVLQDGILDVSQGSGVRDGLVVASSLVLLAVDGSLSDDEDVGVLELLFKLRNESSVDQLESSQKRVRDDEDDRLSATLQLDFLGAGDVKVVQVGLKLGSGELNVEELLGDLSLKLGGFTASGLLDFFRG